MKLSGNVRFNIIVSAICGVVLASKIDIPFLYVSAYVILLFLSVGNGVFNIQSNENLGKPQLMLFLKILLLVFVVGLTYLLFLRLGI